MGEARRRKQAGDTTPRGDGYKATQGLAPTTFLLVSSADLAAQTVYRNAQERAAAEVLARAQKQAPAGVMDPLWKPPQGTEAVFDVGALGTVTSVDHAERTVTIDPSSAGEPRDFDPAEWKGVGP